jgi:hypothetical protein
MSAAVRTDLEAAAQAARRLAEAMRDLPAPLSPLVLETRADELLAHLRWGSDQLRLALNHGGLMLAYARGPSARADALARRRRGVGPIPETLDAVRCDLVARAEDAAQSLDEAAALEDFGPKPGYPRRPGPEYTARYARGHLEALERNLQRAVRGALATSRLRALGRPGGC